MLSSKTRNCLIYHQPSETTPTFFKLGIKLKFTYQQSRDYKQMNYTGGEVGHEGTTKMLFDWKKRSNGYVRDLYSALQESELVAIAEEELLRKGILDIWLN